MDPDQGQFQGALSPRWLVPAKTNCTTCTTSGGVNSLKILFAIDGEDVDEILQGLPLGQRKFIKKLLHSTLHSGPESPWSPHSSTNLIVGGFYSEVAVRRNESLPWKSQRAGRQILAISRLSS